MAKLGLFFRGMMEWFGRDATDQLWALRAVSSVQQGMSKQNLVTHRCSASPKPNFFFFCSVFTQFVPGTCTISASCDLSTSVQPPEKPRTPFHEHHIVFYFPLASSIHLKPHFHPQTYSTSSQFSIPKADQYLSSSIYIALNQGANRG